MRDIVFEWFVPHVPSRKQMLVKAVITSAVIVFFADAFFFAAIMLIPTIVLEYEYVNGDLTISKIIRKEKRKELYRGSRAEIEEVERGRRTQAGRTVRDFTSNRQGAPVLTLLTRGELLYVEPNAQFEEEMKRYYRF